MRYDNVIIGGGLAGLACGIKLLESGRNVAIVSSGQSALHFCSGSFELLNSVGDGYLSDPIAGIGSLDERHPYRKIGAQRVASLLSEVPSLMASAGLDVKGSLEKNSYRLTPLGFVKPAWLTLSDHVTLSSPDRLPWHRAAIINIYGYIDFYPQYLASGLRKMGAECSVSSFNLSQLQKLHHSTTEMRATNIARVLDADVPAEMAQRINERASGCEVAFIPAVLGLLSDEPVKRLRSMVDVPLYMVPTIPASVPGVRSQIKLKKRFSDLGGTYLLGDTVKRGEFSGRALKRIYTVNLGDMPLEADEFVLASGSFFSYGIVADMNRIYEPIFDIDVDASNSRSDWYDKDLYHKQRYMSFGVSTDCDFRAMRRGEPVENLYAVGSVLSGASSLKEGSGAGVALSTALHVADIITDKPKTE